VLKLALTDLDHAGRTAGRLYAWSTAGGILGTFLTGWVLIAWAGVTALVVAAGLGLVALAFVVGHAWRRPRFFGAILGVVTVVALLGWMGAFFSRCTLETDYFCIRVVDKQEDGHAVRFLKLDHLTHTEARLEDPGFLGYAHLYVQSEFVRRAATRTEKPRVLIIGGGGYALPRWIETYTPQVHTEVVEIDPAVTRIALEQFGMAKDTRVVSYNLDGRQFVQEQASRGAYDVVIQDAVNDLSVPYHLMTREYDARIRDLLKPDGVYLLTLIDDLEHGVFLRSSIATVREAFPHVKLLRNARTALGGRQVYVIAGSVQPLDVAELNRLGAGPDGAAPHTAAVPDERLSEYLASGRSIVMTDDYAPVDSLLGEIFLERQREKDAKRTASADVP
jgi:hypothetical protein